MFATDLNHLIAILIFSYLSGTSFADPESADSTIVNTDSGPIEGVVVKSFTGIDVTAYYGIPYAEPPIGNLRFKPPVPVKPWSEVFKASTKPTPCYQQYHKNYFNTARKYNTLIKRPWSEDCLKLNVWRPIPIPESDELPIAILVFIHGGHFLTGSSLKPYSDGATIASDGNIYVASMNYRLGAFGFLNLRHPEAPGNMGLIDQQLALKWLYNNVPKFGGNTGGIVLWGVGAGSASVGYQMLSKGSDGLIRSALLRSGAPNSFWSFQTGYSSSRTANALVQGLNCNKENMEETIECLRKVHPEDIVDAARDGLLTYANQFKPTVDGVFITESPTDAMKNGHVNNITGTLMVSNMVEDGSIYLAIMNPDFMNNATQSGITLVNFRESIKRLIPNLSEDELKIVQNTYIGDCRVENPFKNLKAAVDAYTDVMFGCPMNSFVHSMSKYISLTFRSVYELKFSKHPTWVGAKHRNDQLFFFGYPILGEKAKFTKEEAQASHDFIRIIAPFTRHAAKTLQKHVAVYSQEERNYVYWTTEGTPYRDYRGPQCNFWESILPSVHDSVLQCQGF